MEQNNPKFSGLKQLLVHIRAGELGSSVCLGWAHPFQGVLAHAFAVSTGVDLGLRKVKRLRWNYQSLHIHGPTLRKDGMGVFK